MPIPSQDMDFQRYLSSSLLCSMTCAEMLFILFILSELLNCLNCLFTRLSLIHPPIIDWLVFIVFTSMTSFIWAIRGKVSKDIPTIFQLYREGQFYWWGKPEYPEKTTDLWQLSHLQTWSHNVVSSTTHHELTTSAVICTNCTCSCNSNYHTITTTATTWPLLAK